MSQPVDVMHVAIEGDFDLAQLRREIDNALRMVVREFSEAFSAAEADARRAGAAMGSAIAAGGERAESSLREFDRTAQASLHAVQYEAVKTGAALGGIQGIVAKLGLAAAGAGVIAGLGAIAKMGLSSAASLEQTQIAFNSLLGSAEKGKEVFEGLKKFAAATPFELPELTGTAQRFLAFNDAVGISDDKLQDFLTTLGNIASVTGAGSFGMERVTLAMGQIASSGKLTLDNLNQISEALPGFSGVAAVAAARGTTTAQALKDISAGAIPADKAIQALLDGMAKFPGAAGAMEAQAQTLLGVFSTFKDTVGQSLAGAFQPIIPELKATLTELTPILGDALGELAPTIGQSLIGILGAITPLLEPLAHILSVVLKALNPFLGIIGDLAGELLNALVPVLDELLPIFIDLAPVVIALLDAFWPLIPLIAQIAQALVVVAVPLLKFVGLIATFLANKVIVYVVGAMALAIGVLAEAVRQFGVWLSTWNWGEVLHVITEALIAIGTPIVAVIGWFADLPGKIGDAMKDLLAAVVVGAVNVIKYITDFPFKLVRAIGDGLLVLGKWGEDVVRGIWEGIKKMGGWLWNKVKGWVADHLINPIKNFFGISSPSTLMRDEVGAMIPAGIEEGVQQGAPSLNRMIDELLPGRGPGHAEQSAMAASAGGGLIFGPGSIVINFVGVVPTDQQAMAVGEQVGAGIAKAQARQNTQAAVRMM